MAAPQTCGVSVPTATGIDMFKAEVVTRSILCDCCRFRTYRLEAAIMMMPAGFYSHSPDLEDELPYWSLIRFAQLVITPALDSLERLPELFTVDQDGLRSFDRRRVVDQVRDLASMTGALSMWKWAQLVRGAARMCDSELATMVEWT